MLISFVIFSSAVVSWLLLRLSIPYLRCQLLDKPNARSSHQQPTPRGGGISVVVVSLVSSLMVVFSHPQVVVCIPLIAAPLAIVGLLDDRQNLPASWRFGVQLLTAAMILGLSPLGQLLAQSVASGSWLLLVPLGTLLIAVTAVINFTNFMDGLDGLVAGCMSVTIAALALLHSVPWPLWALVGSLLGFLLLNWSPAQVFLGDVGSTFLGAVFAGFVLQASSWSQAFGYLLLATPLLADAFFCVLRRMIAGQRVFQAHRLHLFQRLHQSGWPHARVSSIYVLATTLLAVAMLSGSLLLLFCLSVAEVLFGVWLDQRYALPFEVASKS